MKIRLLQRSLIALAAIVGTSSAESPPKPVEFIIVELSGKIEVGLVAIGGETTGSESSALGWKFELDFPNRQFATTAGELAQSEKPAYVKGRFRLVKGVERPDRWVIDVTTIKQAEPSSEFVRVECQGKFKANDRIGTVMGNTVKTSGVSWFADLSAAKNPEAQQRILEERGIVRLAGEFKKKRVRQEVPVFTVKFNRPPLSKVP